jgi:hypothetical protein
MIRALETRWDGHRFRSRLEARWAVCFKALGLEYDYEPQGFEIDGECYLPDFYLPKNGIYVEIKPRGYPVSDDHPVFGLVKEIGRYGVLISGNPALGQHQVTASTGSTFLHQAELAWDDEGNLWFDEGAFGKAWCTGLGRDGNRSTTHPKLFAAFLSATRARFEFGEKPRLYGGAK